MYRFDPQRHVKPEYLSFRGSTDAEGKLHMDMMYKQLYSPHSNRIGLWKISFSNANIFNIRREEELIQVETEDGSITQTYLLPSRVVTVSDLIFQLNRAVDDSLFRLEDDVCKFDLKGGKIKFTAGIARGLRLLDPFSKDKVAFFLNTVNENVATFSFDESDDVLEISSLVPAVDGRFVNIPANAREVIYDLVSADAPKQIYFYTNLVEKQLISSSEHPLLAIVPVQIQEEETSFIFDKIQFKTASEKIFFSRPYVQVANFGGVPFADMDLMAEIHVKRGKLY